MFNRKDEEDAAEARPATAEVPDAGDPSPSSPGTTPPATPATSPAGTTPAASAAQDVDIHSLLRRLDDVARAAGDSSGKAMRRVADEVEEHAESLAASVTDRQEAQRLLTLATEERDRASAAGAAIIEEARQIAARLTNEAQSHAGEAMAEIQRWATGQRESIAEVVSELTTAAHREAGTIREDAQQNALTEARRTAEVYVARAAALATREADQRRSEATDLLGRSAEAVSAAHDTMQEFTSSLTSFVATMGEHLATLQEVVEQAEAGKAAAEDAPPIAVDRASWLAAGGEDLDEGLVLLPLDPFELTSEVPADEESDSEESESDEAPAEDAVESDTDTDIEHDADTGDDASEDSADESDESDTDSAEDTEEDAEDTDEADEPSAQRPGPDAGAGFPADDDRRSSTATRKLPPPPPGGRPLGSLFRDLGRD